MSVSATMPESTTEITMVTANCWYIAPVIPPMKATGMNTAQSTSTIATSAPTDLPHRPVGRLPRRDVLLRHDALDVLDHHDGVVHHDADGEHQPEEREGVDREAEQLESQEGADDAHRHRQHRDQRRPPALEEEEDHQRHQHHRLDQRDHHLLASRR